MANPNKTVGNWRRKNPLPLNNRPVDPLIDWVYNMVQNGRSFSSMEEAKIEFEKCENHDDLLKKYKEENDLYTGLPKIL